MKKALILQIAAVMVACALAGCGGADSPNIQSPGSAPGGNTSSGSPASPSGGDNAARVDVLTIAITRDENSLTPITYVSGSPGFDTLRFLYDSLFTISPDNVAVPWMVEDDYTVSADMKVFTMTLREGQFWHDGTPVTGEDVAFTFDYFKNEFTHGRWSPISRQVESVAVNGRELVITLYNANPGFLRAVLADLRIVQKAQYEGVTDPSELPNLGSGAYRLVEYRVGEFYTLEAVEGYFRGTPLVQTIRMPIMDVAAAQQAMIAGQLSTFTAGVAVELIDTFNANRNIEIVSNDGYASTLLLFSNVRPPFDEADFRRAISLALDLDQLVEQITLGNATRGTAGYVRDGLNEHVPGLEYTFDRNASNALLDSLGFDSRDNAGMRLDRNGHPMSFEIFTNALRSRAAEIISMHLESVGLRTRVTVLDDVNVRVWPDMDTSKQHDYEMSMFGWSAPIVQRPGAIIGAASSDFSGVGGQNLPHYSNPAFDALAAEFLASVDPAVRAELNERMQRIVAEDIPFVTLYFADSISAVNTSHYDGWVFPKGALAMNIFSFLPR